MLRASHRFLLGTLAASATLVGLAAAPAPASACDCIGPPDTVASAKARLGVIALGRAVAIQSTVRGSATVTLHVTQAWQGTTAGADLVLDLDASDCGFELLPGDEALVYVPRQGRVSQCHGDDSARVVMGAAIAADLAALGPATSKAAAGAVMPLVATGELIDVDGKVDVAFDGGRPSLRVRVTKARAGAKVGEVVVVTTPVGACGQALPARMTDRVTLRARRSGPAATMTRALISPCLPDTQLKVARRRTSR